ncbi:glycosyl hydrolase family 61-domain-containing protein [Clohesyomyces aquaticus]|uniref:AA9 family lytic polysaccharide monooxygenase n=1 Tax=Clohesyomyces aquaticus TaxID=1231657 RepID=A0A1Y2A8C8_9PLEO|nr:glycosyl hydrolase family 61-domain-containing protein [Clohesyomyces aquaticus]
MKTQSLLLALAAAPATLAHTVWTDFYVNGVAQGDGVAMRMRNDPEHASDPLSDLSSNDLACNVNGDKGVSRVQSVGDGSTLTFEFRSWPNDPTKERIDRGHYGPCAVYLKKVDSAIDDPGHGDGWFKIWDDGYDASTKQWCTDKMIDNNGLMSVVLPKGIKGGYYLARPEILALHNANQGDPQFYAGCAQIFVEGTGNLVPESTVSIPGYVKAGEDSVSWNIYTADNSKYPVPGPAVAKLSSSSNAAGANVKAQSTQTQGLKPAGCICQNANWCGTEVSSYSDEKGCWAAGEECWKQNDACYKSSPPTGNAGCKLWEAKCKQIQDACSSGNFNGPPNKGKDLTPKAETIDVGLVMPTAGVTGGSEPKTSAAAAEKTDKPAATSAAQVKTSAAVYTSTAAAPASSAASEAEPAQNTQSDNYGGYVPKLTKTIQQNAATTPASEIAPHPTKVACPAGYECVTVYTTVVKTEVVYVTMAAPERKRESLQARRYKRVE